ncbi:MAG: hypothetical protein H7X70_02625, partial [Candidatus Kapabacteria bacterium]|nr:hypothetical protein [Candidatus Kapabacteria bacterium]
MKKLITLAMILVPVFLVASYVQQTPVARPVRVNVKDSIRILPKQPSTSRFGVFVPNENGGQTPLRITSMKATTDIRGTLATTTLEIVVLNPNDRTLEGQFSFPVSDGQ